MIDYINENRPVNIITQEDPIEYVYTDKQAMISQREIGIDTHSFAEALKQVLRQTPDVILIGEMRDLETLNVALQAAETGHLVFGTLHTSSAAETLDRISNMFAPHERADALAAPLHHAARRHLAEAGPARGRQRPRGGAGDHGGHADDLEAAGGGQVARPLHRHPAGRPGGVLGHADDEPVPGEAGRRKTSSPKRTRSPKRATSPS